MPTLFDGLISFDWPDHVSSSQRNWFTCRLRAALATGARIAPRAAPSKALLVGKLMHELLAMHYTMEPSRRSAAKMLSGITTLQWLDDWPRAIVVAATADIEAMVGKFYHKYGSDGIVPAGCEISINVPVPDSPVPYVASMDMAYRDPDGTHIVEEWKTSTVSIAPEQYTLFNPQGSDYLWAWRQHQHLEPDARMVLRYLFVTPYGARRMDAPPLDTVDTPAELRQLAVEQRTLPITANRAWHCRSCAFESICAGRLTGASVGEIIGREYRRDARQKEADNDEGTEVS